MDQSFVSKSWGEMMSLVWYCVINESLSYKNNTFIRRKSENFFKTGTLFVYFIKARKGKLWKDLYFINIKEISYVSIATALFSYPLPSLKT